MQNIVISLAVKALIMLLSALGITGMWLAVIGDNLFDFVLRQKRRLITRQLQFFCHRLGNVFIVAR